MPFCGGFSVLENVQVDPANVFDVQLCLGCVAETAVPVVPPPSAPSQPSPTERPPPPPTVEPIVLRERLSFNPDADAMMRTMTLHPQLSSSLRTPMASKDHSHQPQRYVVPLLEMEAANIEEGDEDEGSDDEYDRRRRYRTSTSHSTTTLQEDHPYDIADNQSSSPPPSSQQQQQQQPQVCVDMECANGCVTLIYQGAAVLKGAFGSLRTSDGHVLGTVSVADTAPRLRMSPQHRQAMDTFHDNVVALIEDRLACLNHAVLWGCSVLQNVQVGPANVFELQLCLGYVAETAVPVAPPPSAPSQPSPTERPPPPPTVEPIVLRERLSFNPDADAMMRTMTLHPQLSSSLRTPMASKDHSHQPQRYVVPLLEMEAANIEEGDEDEGSDDEYDRRRRYRTSTSHSTTTLQEDHPYDIADNQSSSPPPSSQQQQQQQPR
ncbi:hypothetical protein H257_17580 [Aphanomyces astaci]|uniref:Uncharacterized protein n=1 Tax=Aphanomyces astaci TaxID=112090 RepID=W4FG65_APHAT|nr:hypothetical protein H257_17580 [Aphanomyces astaci]ETV65859.1 hypothetical protein H257_17580 [Aphanomyces astaci]|eukprot:XP_009844722.1 hypothetical protein H257_17580 [Aphanomyces astaci]